MATEISAPTASMIASQPSDHNTQPSPQPAPPSPQIDLSLVCLWQGCQNPNHTSPEALYDHVTDVHVGRKSTNNLNLQCFWGSCRTTTVKRDHITSHIRVHVPLKPHKCDFCGKSFKRPQDLKKHVKTHADESVLFNSPQTGNAGSRPPPNGYQIPADGSYGEGPAGHPMAYPYGNNPYQGGHGIPANGFQPYGYGMPQTSSYDPGLTENRKRAHDSLNDFFGDAKRRNIDSGQYQDLGARFSQFLQMFAPFVAGGWNGGYNPGFTGGGPTGYDQSGGAAQYQTQAAPTMPSYGPQTFPELRTKNDLMSIDQFLEQLQHTVYDNESAASAFQPVPGLQTASGFGFLRGSSHSPPRYQQAAATPGSNSNYSYTPSSAFEDTPSLTPSSFAQSNPSPQQSHQQTAANARATGGIPYPTLPSFQNAFDNGPPNSMPPSSLGPMSDDYDGRRRYSGGLLQREAPPTRDEKAPQAEMSEDSKSQMDTDKEAKAETSPAQQNIKLPSVSEITRENEHEEHREAEDKPDPKREAWENNIRTIATLRDYIRSRLQQNEYEQEQEMDDGNRTPRANQQDVEMKDEDTSEGQATTPKREGASLYPVLRPVEA